MFLFNELFALRHISLLGKAPLADLLWKFASAIEVLRHVTMFPRITFEKRETLLSLVEPIT